MADFISREAVIQAIEDIDENAGARGSGFTDPERIMRDSAFCALEAIQPADVRPVVRGKWYWDNYRYDWCCSNCSHPADHHIDKDDVYKMPSFPFCPHCGADMRPDKNDQKGEKKND